MNRCTGVTGVTNVTVNVTVILNAVVRYSKNVTMLQ